MRDIRDVPDPDPPGGWDSFQYAFDIADARVTDQDRLRIHAQADVDGAVAGFGLEFERSGWRRDQVYADIWFDWGWGALFSTGRESDVLARFLSRDLGNGAGGRFADLIETDVVMLNSEPDAMLNRRCLTKFFLGETEDSEAQVFINFDLPNRVVDIKEKDLEFRSNLLSNLVH